MEELPRFSMMLFERREALGLTVEQASRVLKLKPSVLSAFEQGDFSNIPQSGYAQGMLSSYARYLGLNPRELVDQFQEDLYEHEHGFGSHELRRRTRESRGVTADSTGNFPSLVSQRTRPARRELSLPSIDDGGDTGSFETTSQVRLRTDAWRESAASSAAEEPSYDAFSYPQGRPYSSRTSYGESSAQRARALTRGERPRARYSGRAADDSGYRRGNVTTQNVSQDDFRDDLVLEQQARAFEAASSPNARRAMANEAPQRPNVRRRDSQASRNARRRSGGQQSPLSDSRTMMLLILGVLALILVVLLAMTVRSCASTLLSSGGGSSVTIVTPGSSQSGEEEASSSSETEGQTQTTAEGQPISAQTSTGDQPAQQEEKKEVVVRVDDGQVSWVEINSDGTSLVAATITGPWEQSFTVESQASIQVGSTSAVSVLCNGETMRFDERASGVGTITIDGPKAAETTDVDLADGEGETDGEDGEGQDGEYSEDSGY